MFPTALPDAATLAALREWSRIDALKSASPWGGDPQSCAMCADDDATWFVGGEGWCADCLARHAVNAVADCADRTAA